MSRRYMRVSAPLALALAGALTLSACGDAYEVRMLQIGRQTPEWTEVLSGLKPGAEYVVDGAFLIRADIEKSGASHDH